MPLRFSFFEVLLLVGICQGFVIAGLIWWKKNHSTSQLLLSLVLAVFNCLCLKILLHTTGLWQTPGFRYFPLPFELAIQPLLWLYIASLTRPGFQLRPGHLVHFVPFAFSLAYSGLVYIGVAPLAALAAKDALANRFYFNQVKAAEDFLSVVSAIWYWYRGLRLVGRYRHWLYHHIADTGYPTYSWLRNLLLLMGLLIAGLAAAILLDYVFQFGASHFIHWQVFFVYLAALIYYLGFRGYQLTGQPIARAAAPPPAAENLLPAPAPPEQPASQAAAKAGLPEEKLEQAKVAILEALETDQLYLDPELNLQKLAQAIGVSPALASAVINGSFRKSFRNLVNDYRVEEVKRRLQDPAFRHLSLLGIGYECGFNSEASFYRIFKAATGLSPKEYRLQLPGAN